MLKYDFMEFIDSPDIREYVKEHHFTPAEEAVLICQSEKTTVEAKIQALEYLADTYSEEEFHAESVGITWERDTEGKVRFREAVLGIIKVWKAVLADRDNNDNVIYAVVLQENDYIQDWLSKWKFFTSYELAYQFMVNQKKEYLEDSSLKHVKTYGEIYRIITDDLDGCYMDEDRYGFDSEMRLVRVFPNMDRDLKGEDGIERDITNQCYAYVPLPFKMGDLVKNESTFHQTGYGVFWKAHDNHLERCGDGDVSDMNISISMWDEDSYSFDYTDDTPVLNLSYCKEDELPERKKYLKLLPKVYKNELDVAELSYYLTKKELDKLL